MPAVEWLLSSRMASKQSNGFHSITEVLLNRFKFTTLFRDIILALSCIENLSYVCDPLIAYLQLRITLNFFWIDLQKSSLAFNLFFVQVIQQYTWLELPQLSFLSNKMSTNSHFSWCLSCFLFWMKCMQCLFVGCLIALLHLAAPINTSLKTTLCFQPLKRKKEL